MNSLICSIFISILGLGSVIYTIIPVVNNNTIFEIVSKEVHQLTKLCGFIAKSKSIYSIW